MRTGGPWKGRDGDCLKHTHSTLCKGGIWRVKKRPTQTINEYSVCRMPNGSCPTDGSSNQNPPTRFGDSTTPKKFTRNWHKHHKQGICKTEYWYKRATGNKRSGNLRMGLMQNGGKMTHQIGIIEDIGR